MNATEKLEMQVDETKDGSAIAQLPDGMSNPQSDDLDDDEDGVSGTLGDTEGLGEDGGEGSTTDDPEREAIRAARRDERRLKKQLHREKARESNHLITALRKQNSQMAERVALLEKRTSGAELARVDKAIDDAANAYSYYKAQIAVGTQTLDGEVVANATENMLLAQRKFDDLNNIKRGYQNQQDKPAPLDPRLVDQAKNWMERNNWYNPAGKDMDSRIALTVDRAMAEEGWNPTTPQYWQELDSRLKKHLPHRATAVHNDNKSRSRPIVSGSGRESASSQSSGTYKLSSDRVNAMKDAGIWDDPIARNKMIATYKQLDRDSSGQR